MSEETPESPAFGDVSAAVETVAVAPTYGQISPSLSDVPRDNLPAWASYATFRNAARSLKAAEDALIAARQVYAEAVKVLSEEAVK